MTTPVSPHPLAIDVYKDTEERRACEAGGNNCPHCLRACRYPPINQKEAHSVAKEALESARYDLETYSEREQDDLRFVGVFSMRINDVSSPRCIHKGGSCGHDTVEKLESNP
jgi:hypothetical protein